MTGSLQIVGIGADGLDGLAPSARAALDSAEVLVGGRRHHDLTAGITADRIAWPSPFDALLDRLAGLSDRRVAVLVTGDPMWFSAGAQIAAAFPDAVVHPHPGAFSLAAARMAWAVDDCTCLSVHGRALAGVIPALAPAARLLILTSGAETPEEVAALLCAQGYGASRMTCLSDMGGAAEARVTGSARDWSGQVAALNSLAVECRLDDGARPLPQIPGLPDDAFVHDGTMTKREVRAITLSRLSPLPGQVLWDLGAGCGSVSVEWMRAARGAQAVAVEPRADRRAMIAANAQTLGVPGMQIRDGRVPDILSDLPDPDAVFFGGGVSADGVAQALDRLPRGGRLVANAVTLDSEAVLLSAHAAYGGDLIRLQVQRAEPVGTKTGWKPHMAVTQWAMVKA